MSMQNGFGWTIAVVLKLISVLVVVKLVLYKCCVVCINQAFPFTEPSNCKVHGDCGKALMLKSVVVVVISMF